MPGKNCLLHFQTLHTEAHGGKFMPDIEWYASQGEHTRERAGRTTAAKGSFWPWRCVWLNYGIFSLLLPPFIFYLLRSEGAGWH